MKRIVAAGAVAAICVGSGLVAAHPAAAQDVRDAIQSVVKDYLAEHPDEVGQIAKQYFIAHPEAVNEILVELLKQHRQQVAAKTSSDDKTAAERNTAVGQNASALFSSPHQVTLGDLHGDVTLVEFFDYNCGYCRHALTDLTGLLSADPKLKIVLKEFPILGPDSVEAARVAIAVRMQDPTGAKYLAFHKKLLGGQVPANKETALAAAKDAGVDMDRLAKDFDTDEVTETLKEDAALARDLALTGTPSYVIGKDVLTGAVGMAALDDKVKAARGQ